MPHKKIIVDKDPFFTIDTQTRVITNQSTKKVTLMKNDHNSERFTFSLPRHIEGHDMAECFAEVHFINTCETTKKETFGMYEIPDLQVVEGDEEKVTGTWLISNEATSKAGTLHFSIRFSCKDESGNTVYVWNTSIHTGITVTDDICNDTDETIIISPAGGEISDALDEIILLQNSYINGGEDA